MIIPSGIIVKAGIFVKIASPRKIPEIIRVNLAYSNPGWLLPGLFFSGCACSTWACCCCSAAAVEIVVSGGSDYAGCLACNPDALPVGVLVQDSE